jgi:hypothetical protein
MRTALDQSRFALLTCALLFVLTSLARRAVEDRIEKTFNLKDGATPGDGCRSRFDKV